MELIAEGVYGAPEVRELESEDDVRFGDCRASPVRMIQRMLRREIHASALIDNGRLQRLRKLDQVFDACLGPCCTIGDDHRIFCRNQIARRLGYRA